MSWLVARGAVSSAPEGVPVRTFLEEGVLRFPTKGQRSRVSEFVIHETVTTSMEATVATLTKSGLSVHLVLGPDGTLTQHGDVVSDVLWHAGPGHNAQSFGVEVVNPYYPKLLRPGLPWSRVIHAPWADGGEYVLPTPAQAEAVASLVRWATGAPAPGIEVPRRWPGLHEGMMALGRVEEAARPTPGVLAHQYFGHADGAWLVLYAWLRLEAGLAPEVAYDEAVGLATGVQRVADVRDLLSAGRAST